MIFDLHNDFPTELDRADAVDYLKANKKTVITAAIWTSEFGVSALDKVNSITDMLYSQSGSRYLPIAVEDIGFLCDKDRFKKFDFNRYLYCSLTWNYDNGFAGGALDDGTLTEKGKQAIDYINHSRCVLDLAHLNKKSFFQALDVAAKVICSHTGFNKHQRSLDDSQIKELVARRAIIGLCTVRKFTDADGIEAFAVVIDRFVQKYGVDSLALGTDFYGSDDIPESMNNYRKLESVAWKLKSYGYTDTDCEKIFSQNASNFFN